MTASQYIRSVNDSLNRTVQYAFPPQKIVSLVPSVTELLFRLGLEQRIAGVTKFCILPSQARKKLKVGGTKNVDLKIIDQIKPDLIIAEKSENQRDNVLEIAEKHPVYVFEVNNFDDALNMIYTVGDLTATRPFARILAEKIIAAYTELQDYQVSGTVIYPVWKNPYFVAGGNTFINSMLEIIGLKNVFASKSGYYSIDKEEITANCPDYILLCTEPYRFRQSDFAEFAELCPNAKILGVDGQVFAWYGYRMLESADYLKELCVKLTKF